jgi:N-acetylmuramoyl-L-alanine amidase
VRRIAGGLAAFFVLTGTLLVLPVYAAPLPAAEPVAPSIDSVDLGSVEQPEHEAVVTDDGTVVDAGPEADVAPDTPVPPPAEDADDSGGVASSGDEVAGVPALTVSQPDTDRFASVGVTWAADPGVQGVTVQLRTEDRAGTWSDWTTVAQDDVQLTSTSGAGADAGVRGGTSPYWTGRSYGVEAIVQAADGSTPRDVQVQLIDPGTSAADKALGPPKATGQAHAAMTMPAIYSRAQWGADESLMGWDHEYAPTIKAATVHHTADGNDYSSADVPAIMRSIYAYHAVSLGWGDIGYNVVVDKFGRAWEGRSGGLASTVVGAHAGGFNYGTFGVSMLGNYDLVDTTPAMVGTVAAVIAWKLSLYGVDPKGTVSLTSAGGGTAKYAKGVSVTLPTVFAHRDVGATACPGRYGYSRMGEIRTLVATKMADPALQEKIAPRSYTRNSNTSGAADAEVLRGDPGDRPLSCDWNGDGTDTIAVYRRGHFFLFDSDDAAAKPVTDFWFGDVGDTPLCGDWDGDGKDSVAVWRAGWFYLRNDNAGGVAQGSFPFGNVNAQPVTGNWDGDPFDTVGVYQGNVLYWTNTNLRPTAAGHIAFGAGADKVVAGDWTGSGRDTIGIYRTGTFYLTNDLARGATDTTVRYGDSGDRPLPGDWNGDGSTTVGVGRGY